MLICCLAVDKIDKIEYASNKMYRNYFNNTKSSNIRGRRCDAHVKVGNLFDGTYSCNLTFPKIIGRSYNQPSFNAALYNSIKDYFTILINNVNDTSYIDRLLRYI